MQEYAIYAQEKLTFLANLLILHYAFKPNNANTLSILH